MVHFNFKGYIIILILVVAFLIYRYAVPYFRDLILHQDTKELYANMEGSTIPWTILATTEQGNHIRLVEFGAGDKTTLIIAAIHGDEQPGFHLVHRLTDSLHQNASTIHQKAVLVPVINPDGLLNRSRLNANYIDINRNFPTDNWTPVYEKKKHYPGREAGSELETQAVMVLIDRFKPDKIISIHDDLHMNNYDGPAEGLARKMAESNDYEVTSDVGYPTPGSLGAYAGRERNIPIVTLELPKTTPEKAWQKNYQALIDAINF